MIIPILCFRKNVLNAFIEDYFLIHRIIPRLLLLFAQPPQHISLRPSPFTSQTNMTKKRTLPRGASWEQ